MGNVSVIIPTWNREDTVGKAIYSALSQTVPPMEVLVCDDGSTDKTLELVQSINDPRVRWIQGIRGGRPAIPRNRGIKESRGEWVAFLDSDDWWLPEKLERQLQLAERLNCMAVCSNAGRFLPDKGIVGNLLMWNNDRVIFDDLLYVNLVICSSAIIHKSIFATVGGFPEHVRFTAIEDYALWLRVATRTDFAFVGEPLLNYCDDPASSLRSKDADVFEQRRIVFDNFKEWGKEHNIPGVYLRKVRIRRVVDLLALPKTILLDLIVRLKKYFAK